MTSPSSKSGSKSNHVLRALLQGTIALLSCGNAGHFYGQDDEGCTDENACNYDPDSTTDDGSCCSCDFYTIPNLLTNGYWVRQYFEVGPSPLSGEYLSDGCENDIDLSKKWFFDSDGIMIHDNDGSSFDCNFGEVSGAWDPTTYSLQNLDGAYLSSPSYTWVGDGDFEDWPILEIDSMQHPVLGATAGWLDWIGVGPSFRIASINLFEMILVSELDSLNNCGDQASEPTFITLTLLKFATDYPLPCPFAGCTDPSACNWHEDATVDDGTCIYVGEGSLEGACNCFGQTLDALGICGGACVSDYNSNGVCDSDEVFGCTYLLANNFSPEATADDGSCDLSGQASNACNFDGNGDGIIGSADLLDFLTQFGAVCN